MNHTSAQYDFELFSDKKPEAPSLRCIKAKKEQAKKARFAQILCYLILFGMITGIILAFIQMKIAQVEISNNISAAKTQLATLESQNKTAEFYIDKEISYQKVQEYIESNGYIRWEANQYQYITTQNQDKVIVRKK